MLHVRPAACLPAEDDALGQMLRGAGATVWRYPLQRWREPLSWLPFEARWRRLQAMDWVLFTSRRAVEMSICRLREQGEPLSRMAEASLVAVGRETARAMERARWMPALPPPREARAETLLAQLKTHLPLRASIWLPRAAKARPLLPKDCELSGIGWMSLPSIVWC